MAEDVERARFAAPAWGRRWDAAVDRAVGALAPLLAPAGAEAPRAVALPDPRAGLRQFLLLDRRLVLAVVALATLFLFCFIRQTDYDWWWHLRTGQLIWEERAIPRADSFSHTKPGEPWVVHEWLFELLLYLGYRAVGYVGLTAIMGAVVVATYTLHYLLLRALGAGQLLAALLTVWTRFISATALNMRAHLFSFLFLAVVLWCLYLYRSGHRRAIWLLPPLTLLWVNLHGAWIVGLGLVALFIAGEWLNARARGERAELRPALGALALATAAVALNPQGLDLYLFPFSFVGSDSATMQYIQEWQAPDFHDFTGRVFGLTVMLTMVLGLRRPRFDYTLALWMLAFTYLGFSSIRHIPLYALVVMPIVVQLLPAAWRRPERPYRESRLTVALNWTLALVAVAVTAALVFSKPVAQVSRQPNLTGYPTAGLAYLRAHPGGGNLLNVDAWGGYLIAELYPNQPVFIDTRVDFYGRAFLEEYGTVLQVQPGWREILRRYDIAQVLLPKSLPLVAVLREDPHWRVVLEGEEEILLQRVGP